MFNVGLFSMAEQLNTFQLFNGGLLKLIGTYSYNKILCNHIKVMIAVLKKKQSQKCPHAEV